MAKIVLHFHGGGVCADGHAPNANCTVPQGWTEICGTISDDPKANVACTHWPPFPAEALAALVRLGEIEVDIPELDEVLET